MFPGLVWLDREVIKEGAAGNEFFSECKAIQNRSEYTWGCDEKENMQHNQGNICVHALYLWIEDTLFV